jgi:hypothetical protein
MALRIKGLPSTRLNQPRRVGFGHLKYITECDKYFGFGETRQESFSAWKEAKQKSQPQVP